MPTHTLWYHASIDNVDTGQRLADPAPLTQCDGVRERTNLAAFISPEEVPGLSLVSVSPSIRFDPVHDSLRLALDVETRDALTREGRAMLITVLARVLETWAYEFELPNPAWQVHFETTPLAPGPVPQHDELEAIRRAWPTITFEALAALTDVELEQLVGRLRPLKPFVTVDRSSDAQHVRALLEAAVSQQQRRASTSLPPEGDDWV